MPVTARLSRKFYDQFGDDVVTELVELLNQVDASSHTSLRELNELNFARFDAKMDALGQRFARFEDRLDGFEDRLTRFDDRLARFDDKLAGFGGRLAHSETNLERGLSATKDSMIRWFVGLSVTLFVTEMLAFVGLWLTRP